MCILKKYALQFHILPLTNQCLLAKHLHYLSKNKEEYNKYFKWKDNSEKTKIESPEFYKLIITMGLPCFLQNLYENKQIHTCSEKCMKLGNNYYLQNGIV